MPFQELKKICQNKMIEYTRTHECCKMTEELTRVLINKGTSFAHLYSFAGAPITKHRGLGA